ncbi:MAG: long-chain fatty acid--CoA ligase [Deltaproteobacteria bacterium]|nr:long-chain fatty acid--CoA ligase [Deltaproteobacteria bacterium]
MLPPISQRKDAAITADRRAGVQFSSLAAMFLHQAHRYGKKVLYRYAQGAHWRSLTWDGALVRVREIALGLISLGVERGERVVIFSNNRVEWLLADWADISIGALTVPIYASGTASQALHIIDHAEPTVLFIDSWKRLQLLGSARMPWSRFKAVVVFEAAEATFKCEWPVQVITLDALRELGRAYEKRHAGTFELLVDSLRPQDDLTIIYTSGTTGVPKGALTTHAHYLFMLQALDAAIPSTERDVTLHFLPTAHALGRLEHFMAVAKGWTLGVARSVETLPSDLKSVRPTVIFSVPRIYENAYARIRLRMGRSGAWRRKIFEWAISVGKQRLQVKKAQLGWGTALAFRCADRLFFARVRNAFGGRLRLAISGGAPLSREIAEFFHALGIFILEGYGLTETSTVSHANRPDRFKFGTVGLPLEGTSCRIAPDGEILLRGPHICKSYYRDLLATEEAIDADGWFHTGDLGEVDNDGFLRVIDRKKDLIVTSGGKKVAPQKLENILKADPLVNQALVVGRGQPHLLALITLDRSRVAEVAGKEGITIGEAENLASHPWVQGRVREIIHRTNKELAPFEAIRDFLILDRDFTVASEELTPTLKPRRQVIVERYKDLIEDMYRKAS